MSPSVTSISAYLSFTDPKFQNCIYSLMTTVETKCSLLKLYLQRSGKVQPNWFSTLVLKMFLKCIQNQHPHFLKRIPGFLFHNTSNQSFESSLFIQLLGSNLTMNLPNQSFPINLVTESFHMKRKKNHNPNKILNMKITTGPQVSQVINK